MAAILEWAENSPIHRAELKDLPTGKQEAILYASADASRDQLTVLRKSLSDHGIMSMLDKRDGQDVLIAKGFKNEQALITDLTSAKLVTGDMTRRLPVSYDPKHKAKPNTRLQAALLYTVGNFAYIISGIVGGKHNYDGKLTKSDWSEVGVGASFAAGDFLMLIFNKDLEDDFQKLHHGFEKYMKEHGIELPPNEELNPKKLHESGVVEAAYNFLSKNMISIKCLTETVAGLFMMKSALKSGEENMGKFAAGIMLTLGWFSTFLLHRNQPTTPDNSLIGKIRENPRGYVATPAAMINNGLNIVGAVGRAKTMHDYIGQLQGANVDPAALAAMQKDLKVPDFGNSTKNASVTLETARKKQYDFLWNILSSSVFLIANRIFGVSEKDNTKLPEEERRVMDELVVLSANTLANTPESVRHYAIMQAAQFAASQAHVSESIHEIAEKIQSKIQEISQNKFQTALSFPSTSTGPALA